jgi:hypothetical protein
MKRSLTLSTSFVAALAVACVCQLAPQILAAEREVPEEAKGYFLEEEPEESQGVVAVRQDAKHGEDVVIVGRIGGRANPWIKGAAAFSIVDPAVVACNEIPGDRCETPWDFCCEANLPQKTVLVMFLDDAGKVLKKDARELLKLEELQTVVIQGKVKRDAEGNVTILAARIFVREEETVTR